MNIPISCEPGDGFSFLTPESHGLVQSFEYSAKEANVSISLEDKTASSIWGLGATNLPSPEKLKSPLQMDEYV